MGPVEQLKRIKRKEDRLLLSEKVNDLAPRIFSLRSKNKALCSRSMMKTIGFLINRLNDYDREFGWDTLIICQISYEDLLKDVEESEKKFSEG